MATVYVQCQERVEVRYPKDSEVSDGDVALVKTVVLKDMFLDWIVEDTVVGTEYDSSSSEVEYVNSSEGWLRDDRPRMKELARLLWAWYGVERKILQFSVEGIVSFPRVGYMVTNIAANNQPVEEINTVVTSVSVDFENDKVTFHTQASELELESLF